MSQTEHVQVQVVYARPEGTFLTECELVPGATIDDALAQSGLLQLHPEIDWATHQVGVFGKVMPRDHALSPGDRVEIYRPLENPEKTSHCGQAWSMTDSLAG